MRLNMFSPLPTKFDHRDSPFPKNRYFLNIETSPRELWRSYVQFHTRSPIKLQLAGLIGALTFPVYYIVWAYIYPQTFESFGLRATGTALCIGLALRPFWPAALTRLYLPFAYVTFMLCLPSFFTLMLLLNEANTIWLMSAMAALVFVMLLYDIANAVLVCALGSALGIVTFLMLDWSAVIPSPYWASLPVNAFLIAAIALYSYAERPVSYEQLTAARTLASNIAHEMRTPLLGIRLDSERLSADVSALESAARWAYSNGWDVGPKLTDRRISQMHMALARITEHTRAANLVIEMLLANASQDRRMTDEYTVYALDNVIDDALSRYHFREGERALVRVSGDRDVTFWGSDVLMVHVLFNLLKNSLTAIGTKKAGAIDIVVHNLGDCTQLEVRDTGEGIAPDLLHCIFLPFISSARRMEGSGMGLAFCKRVIESFGGTISCSSKPGEGSIFTITLPVVHA